MMSEHVVISVIGRDLCFVARNYRENDIWMCLGVFNYGVSAPDNDNALQLSG
jgi:hypothetical protein